MMIPPESYIEQFKNADYLDLIEKRDSLLRFIKNYEENEIAGVRKGEEWFVHPGPDVRYQIYLGRH